MPRDSGCLTDGEMGYDSSSRIEPKRAHQWFMDASEPELFCNKKQAIEAVNSQPMSGIPNVNISLWENTTSFQSGAGLFSDRLFGPEPVRTFNLADRNISVGGGNSNTERKGFEDQVGNDSLVNLSMSHAIEDNHTISLSAPCSKSENRVSLEPNYNDGVGPTFPRAGETFISMAHTFNKGDGNLMLMRHNYNKGDNNILSMGQPFDKGDGNFFLMDQRYGKGNDNIISMGPAYNKEHENFIAMGITYNKANENFISMGPTLDLGDDNIIPVGPTNDMVDTSVVLMGTTYDKGDSSNVSMGQNYNKTEGTTISFGGFQDDPEANNLSGRIVSSCDLLMSQPSKAPRRKYSVEHNADPNVSVAPAATSKTATKNKEQKTPKKIPPNSFPSNVKSLLSTGILDGVPVKYVSWSREKNLRGVIKGTNYLCGCNDCKLSKALNAYEFERHAGFKTKHPNNHIYFENGKTIYAVVQELKSTPQEILFEAIHGVTGSPINQKNFSIWKASYQAATRELQRIYGKNEVIMPS